MDSAHKQEDIFALLKDDNPANETRISAEIHNIASSFYKDLWKVWKDTKEYSIRIVTQLLGKKA